MRDGVRVVAEQGQLLPAGMEQAVALLDEAAQPQHPQAHREGVVEVAPRHVDVGAAALQARQGLEGARLEVHLGERPLHAGHEHLRDERDRHSREVMASYASALERVREDPNEANLSAAMRERGGGRIVSTASAHSLVASPNKSAYVAAKHGLAGLTKAVALETARTGVTVNCISPGYVWTPLVENQIPDTMRARGLTREQVMNDVLLAAQPTRKFVTVDQVAALGSEMPRQAAEVRRAATSRIKEMIDLVARQSPDWGQPGAHERALVAVSTMIGALLLARAVDDPRLSDSVREAALRHLTPTDD